MNSTTPKVLFTCMTLIIDRDQPSFVTGNNVGSIALFVQMGGVGRARKVPSSVCRALLKPCRTNNQGL